MLECIYLFLDENNIFKNSSNYMLILLMVLSEVSLFEFACHNYLKIKNIINQFSDNYNSGRNHKITTNINNKQNKYKSIRIVNLTKRKPIFFFILKRISKKVPVQICKKQNKIISSSNNFINNKKLITNNENNFINKNEIIKPKNFRKANKNKIITKSQTNVFSQNRCTEKFNTQLNSNAKIFPNKNLNDKEINSLDYEQAREKDRRTYFQYYFSLLRTKHILIFTFFQFRDYNSQSIKIYLFFFNFAINYVVSSMFYSEETMHKINEDKGSFDLTYQLPIMVYSSLISAILKTLINNLGLYEEDILSFKKSKNKCLLGKQKVLFRIKCKISFFFIITYILLFFFWAFLGCFCAVYKHTQIHLLVDVASSFALSFISPLFINLLPGMFRMPSLMGKIKRPYLYRFSKLLQLI